MTRDIVERTWHHVKNDFRMRWSKLTTDDIDNSRGKFELLVSALHTRYGITREAAAKELDLFIIGVTASPHDN